ncbi:MAG: holin family protein [Oscillospiraceae bacterium]
MNQVKVIYYGVLGFLSTAGAFIATLLGGWSAALQTLVVLMAIDYLTGVVCALVFKRSTKSANGAFESKASLKGLFKKMFMLCGVWLAYQLDRVAGTVFMREAIIFFFIGNDGLSIVENFGLMGVPLPAFVKNAFEALKKKGDTTETKAE